MDKERRESSVLGAVGEQGPNPTEHIDFVWLSVKPGARVKPADAAALRAQTFALVSECDRRWPTERFWSNGHQLTGPELDPYPVLAWYLNAVKLWPKGDWPGGIDWILFPSAGGFFDRNTMFAPLKEIIGKKTSRYTAGRTGFDDLSLVVIYNRALIYNSPTEMPSFTYDDAAAELEQLMKDNLGPFDRVFLFIAVEPNGRVLRVCGS